MGIFKGNPDYDHWYSNRMIFRISPFGGTGGTGGGDGYIVITDKKYDVIEWPMSKDRKVEASISGRYIYTDNFVVDLDSTQKNFHAEEVLTKTSNPVFPRWFCNANLLWISKYKALVGGL
ncbi:hypothetical protein [Haliscomenobacter hydrossis]|uniref:hypothetical protein n=1 Tax=Haliscomenobacter hydrossis TaxID=2350 RepID=UPI0011D28743|nr:hypothetical protein [Haliscomenobacter hydrossis]